MNGLVAFVVPGRDRYSRAQGTKSKTAGGIEAGATPVLIRTLDRFLPSALPLSATAAAILNEVAATVDPAARRGKFASPFANLSFAEKAKVFQTLEALDNESAGSIRFLAGNLPGLVAFLAYSEAGSFDAKRKRLRRRPLGWRFTRYKRRLRRPQGAEGLLGGTKGRGLRCVTSSSSARAVQAP